MRLLKHLFERNRAWAQNIRETNPRFFQKLARQQSPDYLWVGCSDSRVPANQIVGLMPGEMFVHRNVANVVAHADLNCLSVVEFAVDLLKVKHVIVCGHYGCAGIRAVQRGDTLGLADNWLRSVQDVRAKHEPHLAAVSDEARRMDRLCELNVLEQTMHLCQTTVVQAAWQRRQPLAVHGWIYSIRNGLLQDLGLSVNHPGEVASTYDAAVRAVLAGGRPRRHRRCG